MQNFDKVGYCDPVIHKLIESSKTVYITPGETMKIMSKLLEQILWSFGIALGMNHSLSSVMFIDVQL